MLPLLKGLADGGEHKFSGLVGELGTDLRLTEEELSELLPSGTQPIFANRVGWARLYLKKAGLLDAPRRGFLQITEGGERFFQRATSGLTRSFWSGSRSLSRLSNGTLPQQRNPCLLPPNLRHPPARRSRCSKMLTVGFVLGSPVNFLRP